MALSASLVVAKSLAQPRSLVATSPFFTKRFLSEASSAPSKKDGKVQDFVKVQLEPGEWDDSRLDPIDHPPWKSNAKIISAEDFANRPAVGWGEEFDSLQEAMMTLSWLDQNQTDAIYQDYLDLMGTMQDQEEKTSHEYVVRVVAQKHNITARRTAAIVQLAHNEEQIKKEGGPIHYDIANEVDEQIKQHIRNAYDAYGEEPPTSFVEDPKGVSGTGDIDKQNFHVARVEDLVNAEKKWSDSLVREGEEARLAIDTHVYKEDVDESLMNVAIDANCQSLINNQKENLSTRPSDISPLPEEKVKKERFKYVAKIINTRNEKSKKKKKRNQENTLVEKDGELRVATVAEVNETSWKSPRDIKEFTYAGAKQAWLDRTVYRKTGAWGRFEHKVIKKEEESVENDKEAARTSSADDNDSDSSSSSDEGPINEEGEDNSEDKDNN